MTITFFHPADGYIASSNIHPADNPRYEDNKDIIKDILIGMEKTDGNYVIIEDRKSAIKEAILKVYKNENLTYDEAYQ